MPKSSVDGLKQVDRNADTPYYRQVYDRFRSAIASGVLRPGDRIPSARALTKELGLARGTVDAAYSLLAAEGYIQTRGQAGTIVSLDIDPHNAAPTPPLPADSGHTPVSFRPETVLPLQMGLPALDAFPRKIWARLAAQKVRAMQPGDMIHPPIGGIPDLRVQLAGYLQVSRGIRCTAAQVFVTAGYRQSFALVAKTLLAPGDDVLIEDPGYPPTRQLLGSLGLNPVPVPVDRHGMMVSNGLRMAPSARATVVTPAHQSPLSVSLSLPRRHELLEWASRSGAWIIEDDYDGEYRYVSRPLPALKSLDHDGRVLYLGTFSKVLFPSIRLAYLVVPEAQISAFEAVNETVTAGSPKLTQDIVAEFIAQGHFARHIQRMRKLYADRRTLTASGLSAALKGQIIIDEQPGGMHLILRLREGLSDRALAARMREAGIYAEALSEWTIGADAPGQALLVNFTNVDSKATAEALGQRIAALLA